jgi:hypothetical protein
MLTHDRDIRVVLVAGQVVLPTTQWIIGSRNGFTGCVKPLRPSAVSHFRIEYYFDIFPILV